MDVKAIRQAIAAACNGLPAGGKTLQSKGYVFAGDPPFAFPAQTDGNYHDTADGNSGLVVTLRVLTSRAEDRSGQEMLDDLLADTSIKAAVEADPTLGGECDDLSVTGFTGYQPFEVAGTDYYGAELTVVVLA